MFNADVGLIIWGVAMLMYDFLGGNEDEIRIKK